MLSYVTLERNEKENGTQTLWGRAPSPQTGTRRTLVSEVGTCPSEMTGRSNSRAIRNSRSRSPLTPQVANRIRISSASSEGERGNKRDASATRLKQRSQNDLIEGIENDSEADAEIEEDEDDDDEEEEYDMSELLLLPMYTEEGEEEGEGEMEEDNEPDDSHQFLPRVEYREGEPRVSEVHEPESFYNENALSCEYFEKSSGMGRTSLERARSTMGLTVPTLDNSTILASASAPVLERDLGHGIKSRRVKDYKTVQGNATTAARSLREVEILDPDSRSQKQQSIEYLSK